MEAKPYSIMQRGGRIWTDEKKCDIPFITRQQYTFCDIREHIILKNNNNKKQQPRTFYHYKSNRNNSVKSFCDPTRHDWGGGGAKLQCIIFASLDFLHEEKLPRPHHHPPPHPPPIVNTPIDGTEREEGAQAEERHSAAEQRRRSDTSAQSAHELWVCILNGNGKKPRSVNSNDTGRVLGDRPAFGKATEELLDWPRAHG